MKVSPKQLIDSEGLKLSLTIGRIYEVLGIEGDYYRILTDPESKSCGNEPVLYEPDCFEMVDSTVPDFWVCDQGDDGERYCYPPEWLNVGFFEDYHDNKNEAVKSFWDLIKVYYPETWNNIKAFSEQPPAQGAQKAGGPGSGGFII